MTAGRMLLDGASLEAVAEQLHLSIQTVSAIRRSYRPEDWKPLQKMGVGGRVRARSGGASEDAAALGDRRAARFRERRVDQ